VNCKIFNGNGVTTEVTHTAQQLTHHLYTNNFNVIPVIRANTPTISWTVSTLSELSRADIIIIYTIKVIVTLKIRTYNNRLYSRQIMLLYELININ